MFFISYFLHCQPFLMRKPHSPLPPLFLWPTDITHSMLFFILQLSEEHNIHQCQLSWRSFDLPAPSQRCTSAPSPLPFILAARLDRDPEKTWHWHTDQPAALCSTPFLCPPVANKQGHSISAVMEQKPRLLSGFLIICWNRLTSTPTV